MSEREPLLPTHAKHQAAEYGSKVKKEAKKTVRQYGVDPENLSHQVQEITPSRQSLVRFAQMIGAVKAGKLPSQQQFNSWIECILSSPILDERSVVGSTRLSHQGARVIRDLKGLLACIERVGESKNGDNKIQKFVYLTSRASVELTSEGKVSASLPSSSSVGANGIASEFADDTRQILGNIQQIGQLFITSKEFRDLLADAQFLLRDLTADAALHAARRADEVGDRVRPSTREKQLRGDAIDFKPPSRRDLDYAADSAKRGAEEAFKGARGAVERASKWVDEITPDDVKDEFIERLKQVVEAVQKDPDFKKALNGIFSIGSKWIEITKDIAERASEQVDVDVETPEAQANADFREAVDLLTQILETFSNRPLEPVKKSFENLLHHIQQIYENETSKESKELREFIDDFKGFISRALNQDGFIQSNRSSRMASELYERAQNMMKATGKDANKTLNKLKKDFDEFMDQASLFIEGFEEDPELHELGQRAQRLVDDVNFIHIREAFGAGGQGVTGVLKSLHSEAGSLLRDTAEVMVPRMLQEIQSIPFPRIEYISREADVVIDDMSLTASTGTFVPDRIRLLNRNDLTLEQKDSIFGSNFDTSLYLEIDGLRVKAANVAYYVNKKTGWLGWEDYGFLDLDLGGKKGTKFIVKLENADPEDSESFFKVDRVSVDMSTFKCQVRQSKHWFLNFFLMPFMRPILRRVFQQLLEKQLGDWLQDCDRSLWAIQQRAKVINSYSRTAIQAGQGISMRAYLKAILSPDTDAFEPYGSQVRRSKTDVGLAQGIFVQGPRNEFKLTIGASYSKQLLPGRGGPLKYAKAKLREYEYIERTVREGVREVKKSVEEVREGVQDVGSEAKKAKKQVKGETKKLEKEAKRQERKERLDNGWKSDVFGVDVDL